jgi:hypothetical protein
MNCFPVSYISLKHSTKGGYAILSVLFAGRAG